jgi:magnesium transporter
MIAAQTREPTGPERSQVRAVAFVAGLSLERNVPIEEVEAHLREPESLIWVDVADPGPEELSLLLEVFAFHPLAVEDVASGKQRPKIDEYKGYSFVVTYGVRAQYDGIKPIELVEIDVFIGRNYLVTVHRGTAPLLDDAMGRWTRGGAMMREGVGFLVYTVMDAIIDSYFPVIEKIGDELDAIEEEMYTGTKQDTVHVLLRAKRTLMLLRRVLNPLRETFNHILRRDQSLFTPATVLYFQDVYDHVLRIIDAVDIQRDTVTSSLDAYMMTLSNKLNMVMKTLTVVSVGAAVANLVFGAWGMNVRDIPFTLASPAFWGAIAVAVVLVGSTLFIGAKKGWL